jgi:hypothetical protein
MRATLSTVILLGACSSPAGSTADADDGTDAAVIADGPLPDGTTAVTPAALLAVLQGCATSLGGPYAKDVGGVANISMCGAKRAVYWTADMDIDCDGKSTALCNATVDPSFQSSTAGSDSMGNPLDASALPYVVIPGVSARFNYRNAGLGMGSVVAVIYQNKLAYGVLGDVGPVSIVGEASYQMAKRLGINPNPANGGTDNGVTYLAFTGADGKVMKLEDNAAATSIGMMRAQMLISGL